MQAGNFNFLISVTYHSPKLGTESCLLLSVHEVVVFVHMTHNDDLCCTLELRKGNACKLHVTIKLDGFYYYYHYFLT